MLSRVLLFATFCIAAAAAASDAEFIAPEPLKDLNHPHKVRLVYFLPRDREPIHDFAARINVLMTFVADVYRRDLTARGFKTGGLDFEFDGARPKVHLLRSTNTAAYYSGDPDFDSRRQWSRIIPELEREFGSVRKNLIVAFVETYSEGSAKFEWAGGFALGARHSAEGGVGMFSSWILRDEFCATNIAAQLELLADETPIQGRTANHGRKLNSPRYEFIEDGFGAVAHELGHALGLPHDLRNERSYIMGNGFRHFRVNYLRQFDSSPRVGFSPDDARFLANTRFLNPNADRTDNTAPDVKLVAPDSIERGATNVTVTVVARDLGALAGLLLFDKARDSVVGGAVMYGTNDTVALPVRVRTRGTNDAIELRATVTDRSGNIGRASTRILIREKNADEPATAGH